MLSSTSSMLLYIATTVHKGSVSTHTHGFAFCFFFFIFAFLKKTFVLTRHAKNCKVASHCAFEVRFSSD